MVAPILFLTYYINSLLNSFSVEKYTSARYKHTFRKYLDALQ
ncbi:hypothetical protein PROVRETT_09572 [Providencia rettgeri DSM 1131]|nr:hypothetical protein PROVRETT_09572 [Providencia rettgeri DSM 1131]